MGCSYGNEMNSQEKLAEILIDKRKRTNILKGNQKIVPNNYEDKEIDKLSKEFYEDINDESKLILYLKKLREKGYKEDFEHELLFYFDSLSPINRTEFTGIKGFDSSLDIFKSVISNLIDSNFEAIKKNELFQ